MNDRFASHLGSVLMAISIVTLASNVALAQKGNKKGGGNGGGGGDNAAPVQYRVVQIPYSKGREVNGYDINIRGEVCGSAGVTAPFEAFWYDGQGTTWTLNDLVDSMDPQARDGWNIEWAEAINDAGQMTGAAKRNGQTAAIVVDPYDPVNPFQLLPASPLIENSTGSSINDSGDVLVRATGNVMLLYSSIDQSYTYLTDPGFGEGISERDFSGNVYAAVSTNGGGYRFVVNGGVVTDTDWVPDANFRAINDFGIVTGSVAGRRSTYAMRYDNAIETFKDGRKDLTGRGDDINNSGDIAIDYMMFYTPEHGVMNLEDLIHPDDASLFSDNFWLIYMDAITERDDSGFPMILTSNSSSSSSGLMNEAFILVPSVPSN